MIGQGVGQPYIADLAVSPYSKRRALPGMGTLCPSSFLHRGQVAHHQGQADGALPRRPLRTVLMETCYRLHECFGFVEMANGASRSPVFKQGGKNQKERTALKPQGMCLCV